MSVNHSSDYLTHQWVVAGIVSSSSRFIPVPFIDDLVRDQCRRFVVSQTLEANRANANVTLDALKPYYADNGGCLAGCVGAIAKAPLKLLLFPIRKVLAVVTSVRGVPLEIMRMVLLGRTLQRYLSDDSHEIDAVFAARMRTAFDQSFSGMDFRVAKAAMNDALSHVSGWKTSAMETARQVAAPDENVKDDLVPSQEVETGAKKVQQVLDRPDIVSLFAEFDRRFDAQMKQTLL
ncbi:hypothetical protein [Rhodopirellula sp. SWK7]|uniref:hypothetical protein n=1 Tax=Rhodopirellula sp. SWK7 TaxID=595460 RepID=UPI0002BE35C5|nr:hypothetical protein [Rhodopirellula sp. SWK7]EMI42937.1 hypothetical protein RRSWK_04576 [Rhodopirellula sp. SWK7]